MNNDIYVFGHQNPDTDSVCASISYSYLKNEIDKNNNYIASALKEPNEETKFVLNYFDVKPPKVIKNLKPQVLDININKTGLAKENDSINETLTKLTKVIGKSIPVVDYKKRLIGMISIADIVPELLSLENRKILKDMKTPFKNIVRELELHRCTLDNKERYNIIYENTYDLINGEVYLSIDLPKQEDLEQITKNDLIICNISEWDKYKDLAGGIIVGGLKSDEEILELAKKSDKHVKNQKGQELYTYYSKKSIFKLAKSLVVSVPISTMVVKTGLEYFVTYETIDDVKDNIMSSSYRTFPVVNEIGVVEGMISRSNLLSFDRKKSILVDHNERGQSIDGIDEVDILEVIDHHRVADVSTMKPLYFRVEPVGCTCTIVAKAFKENNVEIPKHIAGLMLSAIISDTLLFNSPTCTNEDIEIANELAKIANIETKYYGIKMLGAGSDLRNKSPEDILNEDRKKFTFGEYKVTISQVNTGDFDGLFAVADSLIQQMKEICKEEGNHLFVLLITDVLVGGTELIPVGEARWIAENAFEIGAEDTSRFLPDVFSRKKQIVPKLMNAAKL